MRLQKTHNTMIEDSQAQEVMSASPQKANKLTGRSHWTDRCLSAPEKRFGTHASATGLRFSEVILCLQNKYPSAPALSSTILQAPANPAIRPGLKGCGPASFSPKPACPAPSSIW